MTRTDKLHARIASLAPAGDSPELTAAVSAYIARSRRDLDRITNPWWERAIDRFLDLPYNRRFALPVWAWIRRHDKIMLPVGVILLAVEAGLLARYGG